MQEWWGVSAAPCQLCAVCTCSVTRHAGTHRLRSMEWLHMHVSEISCCTTPARPASSM